MNDIYTSRTRLPPLEKYTKYLKQIWESNWLTNNGELVQELEKKLAKRFGVKHVVCVSSGTSALLIALRAMDIQEIYTSPYSFIATVSAPLWMGIKVHFVDEGKIYPSPALVTHVYGIPNLVNAHPVIYDASHAFAVNVGGHSILSYGDCSIISFHAVKIFQTIEGGAVVTNNDEIAQKARWMRNYGFKTHYSFQGTGVNFKMNEFEAAMGLCSLEEVDDTVKKYKKLIKRYNEALGLDYKDCLTYYPIWYETEEKVIHAIEVFEKQGVYPRRYFYPPLNTVFDGEPCPVAEENMKTVLCIPLYYSLTEKEQDKVIQLVKETL
jgi:dTDP-4-amino-4,6-dideoxygalactose transaminase